MSYAEAIQFLYGLQLFGAHFGLERVQKLVALTGSPEKNLRFIHVAGTNGKGSTCAMLENIYRVAGLRVGLFTSPHLVSFRERIQINRQLIPQNEIVRLVAEIQPLLKQFPTDNHPTMFEVVTVMALKYFAEQKCDLVVWETGLGGRLDATNIVTPLVSVITNIAFDHTEWLGDTLAKIAAEKAGIIKPGVPVITAETNPEALNVIEKIALGKNARLKIIQERLAGKFDLSLLGKHQQLNAALAVATVEELRNMIPVRAEQIQNGLANVIWPGRLQVIQRSGQKILLDGAHNVAGAEMLRDALKMNFASIRTVFIFGALADKKWPDICRVLAPLAAKVITVPVASERTMAATKLSAAFYGANEKIEAVAASNFAEALSACKDEPFVVVTGSLYLVGEALEQLGCGPADDGERGLNDWKAAKTLR